MFPSAMFHFNRWASVVAGMYLMSIAGTIYLYPDYSGQLRSTLGLTVEQTDFIGTMINLGSWMGIVGGLVYDRFGPKPTGAGGCIMLFAGYFLMQLVVRHVIPSDYRLMGVFALLMGQGSSWMYTVALNTNLYNFRDEDRGKIVGILVCMFGLCAGIFSQYHSGLFPEASQLADLLLFLACATSGVALLGTLVVSVLPDEAERMVPIPMRRVNLGYLLVITVALYIAAASLAKTFAGVITPYFAAGLAGLLSLLVLLSLRTGKPLFSTRGRQGKSEEEALLSVQDGAAAAESLDFTFLQSLVSLDFWIIFFIFFAGIGSGIAVVNNLPEIVISRLPMSYNGTTIPQEEEPHVNTIHTFVVLFSVFNTFGRLLSGYLSDALRRHLTRPAWLMISTTLMAVVQLVFVWASVDVMYAAVVLLGLSYGTFFCMIPTFVSEAFGVAAFGANFGLQGLAPAMGSEVLGTLLAGKLDDSYKHVSFVNITRGNSTAGTIHCLGSGCYHTSLLVNAGMCGAAFLAAAWLTYRHTNGTANTTFGKKFRSV